MLSALALIQAVVLIVLTVRLLPGRRRLPAVDPVIQDAGVGDISVVVATLNEAHRIQPCLAGLTRQGPSVREILFVDSGSTDGTQGLIERAGRRDPRIRLLRDDPLPRGWVGKVWALQHGLQHARGTWVLGVDADTAPAAGMAAGALAAATTLGYDVVSFAPRFDIDSAAERWLQPALLVTLIYRFGAAGTATQAERMMANGQCFLARREVLLSAGGYASARASFSDDVTLARNLARTGHRVGFLDGAKLYSVRAYSSATEAWREWGRSLDLKDSTSRRAQWLDVLFLLIAQGTPIPVIALLLIARIDAPELLAVSGALFAIRVMLTWALRPSYVKRGIAFWLSPLADPFAAGRILLSTLQRPRTWRGRVYSVPT